MRRGPMLVVEPNVFRADQELPLTVGHPGPQYHLEPLFAIFCCHRKSRYINLGNDIELSGSDDRDSQTRKENSLS